MQTIDSLELEKMLDSAALFVTKNEIKEILTNIDADESESLDFFECLKVKPFSTLLMNKS